MKLKLNIETKGSKIILNMPEHIHEEFNSIYDLYTRFVGPDEINWAQPQQPPRTMNSFGEELFWILYKEGKFGHFGHLR